MFWMFNRKPVKSPEVVPAVQELSWQAILIKEDGYMVKEWGKARYDSKSDTASIQYVTNYLDGTVKPVVKNNLSIVEVLAELAILRERKNVCNWNYMENTWQSSLKNAMEVVQVSSSFSVSFTHPPIVAANSNDVQETHNQEVLASA